MRPASVLSRAGSGRSCAPSCMARRLPIRKSRLPRPSQSGVRMAAAFRASSDAFNHGSGRKATSSPIHASKMSPARINVSASRPACSRNAWKAAAVAGESGPRWMSDAIQTRPGRFSLFNDRGFLDDDIFGRHVLMEAAGSGLDALDLVDGFSAFDHLAENCIAPAIAGWCCVVQEIVVRYVDEELRSGGMRIGRTGHGNGVAIVLQTIVGFVLNRLTRFLLLHAGFETAALDHEIIDDAVEDRAVVEAFANVLQKVGSGLGGFFGVELNDDFAMVGLELNARFCGHGGCTFCSGVGGCRAAGRCKQRRREQGGPKPSQAGA